MTRKIPSSRFKRAKTAGKKPKTAESIETVVTFLAMEARPHVHVMPPANLKVTLMKVKEPTVSFYRYLYREVGRDYYWIDRDKLTDDELASEINAEGVDVFVAYVGGCPAGYYEIDARRKPEVWLAYFGLIPEFHGLGLGKWLLGEALKTAWLATPERVCVETCTLDAPHALALYQKFGFKPYERRNKTMYLG